jgi:hypothetical protein
LACNLGTPMPSFRNREALAVGLDEGQMHSRQS